MFTPETHSPITLHCRQKLCLIFRLDEKAFDSTTYYAQRELSKKIIQYASPLMDVIYLTWEHGRFYVTANDLETRDLMLGLWYQRASEEQVFNLGEYEIYRKIHHNLLNCIQSRESTSILIDLFYSNGKCKEISGSGLMRNEKTCYHTHDNYVYNSKQFCEHSGSHPGIRNFGV